MSNLYNMYRESLVRGIKQSGKEGLQVYEEGIDAVRFSYGIGHSIPKGGMTISH